LSDKQVVTFSYAVASYGFMLFYLVNFTQAQTELTQHWLTSNFIFFLFLLHLLLIKVFILSFTISCSKQKTADD